MSPNFVPSPIATEYNGARFRSRIEADVARRLDRAETGWLYEPRSFLLPRSGLHYQPDFWLPDARAWIECKPAITAGTDARLRQRAAEDKIRICEFCATYLHPDEAFILLRGNGTYSVWPRRSHRSGLIPFSLVSELLSEIGTRAQKFSQKYWQARTWEECLAHPDASAFGGFIGRAKYDLCRAFADSQLLESSGDPTKNVCAAAALAVGFLSHADRVTHADPIRLMRALSAHMFGPPTGIG